jgi:hypothetical protein
VAKITGGQVNQMLKEIVRLIKPYKGHLFTQSGWDGDHYYGLIKFHERDGDKAKEVLPKLQALGKKMGFNVEDIGPQGGQANIKITVGLSGGARSEVSAMSMARIVAELVARGEEDLAEELLSIATSPNFLDSKYYTRNLLWAIDKMKTAMDAQDEKKTVSFIGLLIKDLQSIVFATGNEDLARTMDKLASDLTRRGK